MAVVLSVDASDNRQVVHLLCRMRQQFADMNSGHRRRNGSIRSSELSVRFWIPAFKLTHSSVQPDEQNLLVVLLKFLSDDRFEQAAESANASRRSRGTKKLATRNGMITS